MKPVITVVVPVYKVEAYLRRCIDSICGQTLREIEIILVDDGSPDNCGKICDEYAVLDSRIRVIHQENRGLSAARNVGIDAAQADLIGFVDSDDWIEPDMYELLYGNLVREKADISVCGRTEHKNGRDVVKGNCLYTVQSGREAVRNIFQLRGVGMAAWNKLFRRHLFNQIRFPEGHIYEDNFIMVRLIDSAQSVVFDMQPKYHYMLRNGSITTLPYRKEVHDFIDASFKNYSYVREKYPDLTDIAWNRLVTAHFLVLKSLFVSPGIADAKKEQALIHFLKENRNAILSNPRFSMQKKAFLLVLCVCKPLCKSLVRMLK